MDQKALISISKAWSCNTELIYFITSQGHMAYLTVTWEWPAAANRRRTNLHNFRSQRPLIHKFPSAILCDEIEKSSKFSILFSVRFRCVGGYLSAGMWRSVTGWLVTDRRQTELFYVWRVGKIIFVRLAALRSTAHVLFAISSFCKWIQQCVLQGTGDNYVTRNFMTWISSNVILEWKSQGGRNEWGVRHI